MSSKALKSIDMYGEGTNFTFRKESKFKTLFGAILSIFVISLFIAFSLMRAQKLVGHGDPFLTMIMS